MSRMPGGELWTVREWLGLSRADLARLLEVREDTVRQWELGRYRIPHRVREEVESLERITADVVDQLVTALHDSRDQLVEIYRETDDIPADRPDVARFGARWWRHVVARACHEVPGVVVGTRSELETLGDDTRDADTPHRGT